MNLQERIDSLNQLRDQPLKIVWKEVKFVMSQYGYYCASDMARIAGYSKQYIARLPTAPIFERVVILDKPFTN